MNKLLYLCLMIITMTGFLLAGCNNNPYKNMTLVVEQEVIEIVMEHESDVPSDDETGDEESGEETKPSEGEETDETAVPANTAYLEAYIQNKNKKQSKRVLFDIVDKSLATLTVSEKDGVYTATIKAILPGETVITVMSLEGGKKKEVALKIVEPIKGLAFDPSFSLAVAVGDEYQFSNSHINYEPIFTTEKDVTYSIEEETSAVSITPNGLLTVSSKPTGGYVTVVARSVANEELVTSTQVYIYNPITESDVNIVDKNGQVINELSIGKNTSFNNLKIGLTINNSTEEFIAYASVSDNSIMSIVRDSGADLSFIVTGIEPSTGVITFNVGIKNIKEQKYVVKTLPIEILDLVDTIYVNSSSKTSTVTVFDSYASTVESAYGTRILIEVAPTTAKNKILTFEAGNSAERANLDKLDFYTVSGQKIPDILSYELDNDGIIYAKLKSDQDFTEFSCNLYVVANSRFGEDAKVYNNITINVKRGIQRMSFVEDNVFIELNDKGYREFAYIINDSVVTDINIATVLSGFDLSEIRILIQKSNVLSARIQGGRLYILPLSSGTTTLTLRAPNGVTTVPAVINVVVPVDSVVVDVNRALYKESIASIERDGANLLSKINLNVNSTISLNLQKSQENGTVWDLSFVSSRTPVATVTSQGTIRALSAGSTTITVNYKYARIDEITGNISEVQASQEIELFVFMPITQFNIGKSLATAYDVNTIGYYDSALYSTIDFNVAMNDAYIDRSQIRIYLKGEEFDIENSSNTYKIVGQGGILFYHGYGRATFLAKIDSENPDFIPQVGVVAEIHEFDRVYRSNCDIKISKATTVNEIVLYNANARTVDNRTYYSMDFRAGAGLGDGTTNTKTIELSTLPTNAVNSGVYYFAYDYLKNNTISSTTPASEVIKVSQDGTITPLKAGDAKVVIVPRDQLYRYDLNNDGTLSMAELLLNLQQLQIENSRLKYKEILVHVADGTLENPYYISNASEFLDIETGLNAHYELVETIDLSKVVLSTFGTQNNPFTGSISGRHYLDRENDIYIESKIVGVNLFKTFSGATEDTNFALFGTVYGSVDEYMNLVPSFKNLTIEFASYNVEISANYSSDNTFNLAYLTADLKGVVENVNLIIRNNGNIKNLSSSKVNFGAIVGNMEQWVYDDDDIGALTRASKIANSKVIGGGGINIDLLASQNASESYIGGIAGKLAQNTSIEGEYSFANDLINDDSFVFSFNGQGNDLIFNISVSMGAVPTLMGVGGIAGSNAGTVKNMSAFANIAVKKSNNLENGKNIGGIVGINSGSVEDVFSRCGVSGETNVGGIVGTNTGIINSAVFESYEDGSSFVKGRENVGGVVGYMQGGAMDFCSSASFIASDALYAVVGYAKVGGLVGYSIGNATISHSYATTKVGVYSDSSFTDKYAGGLVGVASATTIRDCYAIVNLYRLDTFSPFTFGGFIGRTMASVVISQTYSVSNANNYVGNVNSAPSNSNSFYYLESGEGTTNGGAQSRSADALREETTYSAWSILGVWQFSERVNSGYPYLLYRNNQEFITVVPTSLKVVVKDTVENQHIKVSDNRAVILNQQSLQESNERYTLDFASLIDLNVEPLTNRIVRVKATLVEGANVVRIDGGNMLILGDGYAKIKISSQLNEEIFDYLEIYVVSGVNSFVSDVSGELNMLLNTSKEIHYTFENGLNQVGATYGIAYSNLEGFAGFNYGEVETLDEVEYVFVDYNYTKIITAQNVVENQVINEIAYVKANFDGDEVKVFVPWTTSTMNLTIYNGATELNLDKQQFNIKPSQKATLKATISTDRINEVVNEIVLRENDEVIGHYTITLDEVVNSIEDIYIEKSSEDLPFNVMIVGFEFDEINQTAVMTFEFEPTSNLQKIDANRVFSFNLNVLDKLSKTFALTVVPQPVERISVLHFPDGNLHEDEVATDRISSGVNGLFKINVYPSYSQIDYIDVVSSVVNGEKITFLQYIMNNGALERMYPEAEQIENGIRLNLASFRGVDGYEFDGYIYVSTLIRSNMAENLPFVVTLRAYNAGSVVYEYQKTLLTQFSPSLFIDYEERYYNKFARGTEINVPISIRTMTGTLTASVEGLADPTLVSFALNRESFNGRFVGQIMGRISSSIDLVSGTQFTLKLELDTIVDNVRMIITDEITLTVVDYIITGVAIDTAYTQNNNNILDIELNIAKTLQAKLVAVYATLPNDIPQTSYEAEKYREISSKISAFEKMISSQNGTAGGPQVWYTSESAFQSSGGTTNYYGYNYLNKEGGYYAIYGTRISAVDRITLNISFYYDGTSGNYEPKLINKALDSMAGLEVIDKTMTCLVNVRNTTTEEVPLPIYSQAEFEDMQEGAHYILMRDITLETYSPIQANFASLDGNGYIIHLNSLIVDKENASSLNVGLFSSVDDATLIKNVVLDINGVLNNTIDLTNVSAVNFGWFAGVNNGVITNCEVVNIVELGVANGADIDILGNSDNIAVTINTSLLLNSSYTTNYIGLFVGENSGYITNSRVGRDSENIGTRKSTTLCSHKIDAWVGGVIDLVANGVVGGFAGINLNTISTSYVKNISINNNSVIASVSSTAGFTALNGGTISESFAEGRVIDSLDYANLKSQGSVAGFVLTNDGAISNSYAQFVIRSPSNSAGFVGANNDDASIEYSYTASRVLLADGEVDDNASFRPFVGVDDFNQVQNEGSISYSYYLKNKSTVVFADEPAIAIDYDNQSQESEYVGFAFIENKALQNHGIWSLEGYTLPRLNTANQIAISQRELANILDASSQEDVRDTPLIYAYTIGYELGSEINPYIINTAVKFNNLMENSSVNGVFGTNIVNVQNSVEGEQPTTKFIRIVRDLNFGETSATVTGLSSSKVTFSAVLEGNSMLMSNITLTGEKSADVNQVEFGLFERLNGAVIKNLRLQFSSVSATEIPIVGGLAGSAVDSILLGINIESQGAYVQGKNIVGGLVGIVVGSSEIQSVASNISVRATYRKGSTVPTYNDLSYQVGGTVISDGQMLYTTSQNSIALTYGSTSYAGGLIGAVINIENDTQSVRTLKTSGMVAIGAERTGGIVAINYGRLYDLNFVVTTASTTGRGQELSGDEAVGGLVGVNHGRLEKGRITYEGDDLALVDSLTQGVSGGKNNLFIGASDYIGGLVGKNMDGEIYDSYSRVNVVNTNAKYAGGLVGYNKGGAFESLYTTGNVEALQAFGGMFGYMDKNTIVETVGEKEKETLDTISIFSNIVLANNYTISTAQNINRGAVCGTLAGFANVANIGELFDYIGANSTNYAVYRLPLNTAGTSMVDIPYFGQAQFDRMEIDQDEYNERFENLNKFTLISGDVPVKYGWFSSAVGDFATASYQTLYRNRTAIFDSYSSEDWTVETSVFPLLKITAQASEIIITEDNRSELLKYLQDAPNATYIIRCDIDLYSTANRGHLAQDWTSLGSQAVPFSGKFIGEEIVVNGERRYPIINIRNPFINNARSASVTNLTFNVVSAFTGNVDTIFANEDFYYGVVANYLDSCSLSNITVTNSAKTRNPSVGMNIQFNRMIDEESEHIPANFVGSVVGYSTSGSISNVISEIPMYVNLQTEVSASAGIASYVGGVIGYAVSTKISDIERNVYFDKYWDGNAYYQLSISTSNGSVGGVIGYSSSTQIVNVTLQEKQSENYSTENMPTLSAKYPINVINTTSNNTTTTNVRFGGVIGTTISSNIRENVNNLSVMNLEMSSNYEKTFAIGGLAGVANSSTFTEVSNNAQIRLTNTNNTVDRNANEIMLGGLIGQVNGESQISGQNAGAINIALGKATQATGYVGGLIGESALNTSVATIIRSRNLGNISAQGLYVANVGGLVGRSALSSSVSGNNSTTTILTSYSQSNIVVTGLTDIDELGKEYTIASVEHIGGLVGYANRLNVSNCYTAGSVMSKTDRISIPADNIGLSIGGFIGRLVRANVDPTIENSYSACIVRVYGDAIKNAVHSKEFIGSSSLRMGNSALFSSCYYALGFAQVNAPYDNMNAPSMHDISANALTYYNMTRQTSFRGLDFNAIWTTENGNTLPLLVWATDSMGTSKSQGSVYRPNIISTAEEFLAFTQTVGDDENIYTTLSNNIELNGCETRLAFKGVFDGGGFIVAGQNKPLFDVVDKTAVVTNINVTISNKLTLTSAGNFGAIANINNGIISYVSSTGEIEFASAIGGTIEDKTDIGGIVGENHGYIGFSSSNVSIKQTDVSNTANLINIGGIAGAMANGDDLMFSQISNSFASGTLTLRQMTGENASFVGGLVGAFTSGNLRESYVNGRIDYKNSVNVAGYGAVIGGDTIDVVFDNASIELVYNDYLGTLVRSKQTSGGCVVLEKTLSNYLNDGFGGFDSNVWSMYSVDRNSTGSSTTMLNYGYPYLKNASKSVSYIANKGNGKTRTPLLIKNQSGFDLINYLVSQDASNAFAYSLDSDIYCYASTADLNLTFIQNLIGTLDGANKTIYNMDTIINNANYGFVNTISAKGAIQNMTFDSPRVNIASNFTGVVEGASNLGVGAVVGINNGTLSNVSIKSLSVSFETYTGGTSGSNSAVLSIGGAVGVNNGTISAVAIKGATFTMGNTSSGSQYINLGGLVGMHSAGTIGNSTNAMKDELNGDVNCTVDNLVIRANSLNAGVHTKVYKNVGGLVGSRSGRATITNCSVTGSGYIDSSVTTVIYVASNNNTADANVGGLVGYSGNISGTDYSVSDCQMTTHIVVNADSASKNIFVGGIVGFTESTMNNLQVYALVERNGDNNKITYHNFGNSDGFTNVFTNTTTLN